MRVGTTRTVLLCDYGMCSPDCDGRLSRGTEELKV